MISNCPRCGAGAYESLRSHSYCIDCNYSPTFSKDHEPAIPRWAVDAINETETAVRQIFSKLRGPIEPAIA